MNFYHDTNVKVQRYIRHLVFIIKEKEKEHKPDLPLIHSQCIIRNSTFFFRVLTCVLHYSERVA